MRRAIGIFLALSVLAAVAPAATQARTRFDTRVLAKVPAPGYPAQAYVHPNGRVYEGTYINANAGAVPVRVRLSTTLWYKPLFVGEEGFFMIRRCAGVLLILLAAPALFAQDARPKPPEPDDPRRRAGGQ